MTNTSMTTMKVKEINKNKVYSFIYNQKTTCKMIITKDLHMGLSTVTQNLKILEEDGLIRKNGFYDSTGGRKADALEIVTEAKISIGIAVMKNGIHIVATDLYGKLIKGIKYKIPFVQGDSYYEEVGEKVVAFIHEYSLENILGVSIATQGIISKDGTFVSYGELMGNTDMKLADFQKYIPFPCRLEHDSKSATNLELWNNKGIQNAVVLLLNENLGGAIITGGTVGLGDNMRSGTIEHLCMNTDGAVCYCGKRGCLETYCSANSLAQNAGMDIETFFQNINETKNLNVWHDYLSYLAMAIRNLSVIIDGKFIISGYLAPFFKDEDVEYLVEKINKHGTFPLKKEDIILGSNGQYTQAIGASLFYIEKFLREI